MPQHGAMLWKLGLKERLSWKKALRRRFKSNVARDKQLQDEVS